MTAPQPDPFIETDHQPDDLPHGKPTYFAQILNFFIPPLQADLITAKDSSLILTQGRERILTAILRASTVLGLITLFSGLPGLVRYEQWLSISIYVASLGTISIIAINRRIDYRLRASLFLLIAYGIGVLDLVDYGPGEDSRIFLFSFAVSAIMLLGARVGLGALSLSVATVAGIGWQISTGQFKPGFSSELYSGALSMETVLFLCVDFLLSAGLVMAALYALLRDFETAWKRERLAVSQVEGQRDLLEQRVSERTQELAQARDQALAASRLKSELLAKVSHELRTPLGAILGFTEMLNFGVYGPLSDKQREITTEVIQSTHFLTSLVNELLNQAQLDAGKLKLNLSPFVLRDVVEEALSKMAVLAQNKGLTLTTTIAPDMPATLVSDPCRVQQILVNLVSNAIKFTKTGTIQVCFYQPDPTHWALRVSDTGSGIPPEAQAYIFEPFRQVDGSITRQHGGAGLGLSIVKQLTTLMGGQITLKSKVGEGSTFLVLFPLQLTQEKST